MRSGAVDTAASRWRHFAVGNGGVSELAVLQGYMNNLHGSSPLRWRYKHLPESNSSVPASPCVYVIGHHDSLHGFHLNRVYVYVGETRNLRRRLDEHRPDTEQNPDLRAHLRRNYTNVVCWYAPTDAGRLRTVQDDLIRQFQPEFNTLGL